MSLVGRMAPDFELRSASGKTLRLSGLRGRPVLLNFWATWCVACRVEAPWLVELQRRHREAGLAIVGVSLDDPPARGIPEFIRANRVTYPILLGGKLIAGVYGGVRFLPQTLFISRDGRVIETVTGIETEKALEDRVRRLLRPD